MTEKRISGYGVTIQHMASRIYQREDNCYKHDCILDVIKMYMEECFKSLEHGEKINLHSIGTLTPRVHTPRVYGLLMRKNSDGLCLPYTDVHYTKATKLKQKMNSTYIKNIKNGYAGLGEKCECTTVQKTYLRNAGYLSSEENSSAELETDD